jgi:hypothetical protein
MVWRLWYAFGIQKGVVKRKKKANEEVVVIVTLRPKFSVLLHQQQIKAAVIYHSVLLESRGIRDQFPWIRRNISVMATLTFIA